MTHVPPGSNFGGKPVHFQMPSDNAPKKSKPKSPWPTGTFDGNKDGDYIPPDKPDKPPPPPDSSPRPRGRRHGLDRHPRFTEKP